MQKLQTKLDGVFLLEPKVFTDDRGEFIKVFSDNLFADENLKFAPKESYFSVSKKNVIRGMHFQTPPEDHAKLVYVTSGVIAEVILDIRAGSPTYGRYVTFELSFKNHVVVFIPPGFAHGFLSLKDDSLVVYLQSTGYAPENDAGIRFNSFGMNWGVKNPIVSARDQSFPLLRDFKTPFKYLKKTRR